MTQLFWVALGGALGAMARSWMVAIVAGRHPSGFFLGTMTVNVLGSFAIGVVWVMLQEFFPTSGPLRNMLMVGFLGAFTTFSSFSLDTWRLVEQQQWLWVWGNVLGSVSICLLSTLAGLALARTLFG